MRTALDLLRADMYTAEVIFPSCPDSIFILIMYRAEPGRWMHQIRITLKITSFLMQISGYHPSVWIQKTKFYNRV